MRWKKERKKGGAVIASYTYTRCTSTDPDKRKKERTVSKEVQCLTSLGLDQHWLPKCYGDVGHCMWAVMIAAISSACLSTCVAQLTWLGWVELGLHQ